MKEPKTAAVLGLLLGPLGYLYVGWRFMLASSVSLLAFLALISVVGLPSPWTKWWVGPVMLLVLAAQGHAACQDANEVSLMYSDDPQKRRMAEVGGPVGMAVGLFFVLSEAYLAALAVSLVGGFALHGRLLRAAAYLLGGAVVVWVVRGIALTLGQLLAACLGMLYFRIQGWNRGGYE